MTHACALSALGFPAMGSLSSRLTSHPHPSPQSYYLEGTQICQVLVSHLLLHGAEQLGFSPAPRAVCNGQE